MLHTRLRYEAVYSLVLGHFPFLVMQIDLLQTWHDRCSDSWKNERWKGVGGSYLQIEVEDIHVIDAKLHPDVHIHSPAVDTSSR